MIFEMRQPATGITPNLGNHNRKIDRTMVRFSSVLWIFSVHRTELANTNGEHPLSIFVLTYLPTDHPQQTTPTEDNPHNWQHSPLLLMIQSLFKSIFTIVLFKGPKETRDVSTFLTFQIFWIFLCRFPYLEVHYSENCALHCHQQSAPSSFFPPRFLHIWLLFFHIKSVHFYIWKHAPGLTTSTPSSFL